MTSLPAVAYEFRQRFIGLSDAAWMQHCLVAREGREPKSSRKPIKTGLPRQFLVRLDTSVRGIFHPSVHVSDGLDLDFSSRLAADIGGCDVI
jgi:hypothetical protein